MPVVSSREESTTAAAMAEDARIKAAEQAEAAKRLSQEVAEKFEQLSRQKAEAEQHARDAEATAERATRDAKRAAAAVEPPRVSSQVARECGERLVAAISLPLSLPRRILHLAGGLDRAGVLLPGGNV